MRYEYKVIPAPLRGLKGKGVKGADGKFANAIEQVMNDLAAEGWEYQRAETLPSEERAGLTSKTTTFRNLLVFRRPVADEEAMPQEESPKLLPEPEPEFEDAAPEAQDNTDTGESADTEDDTRL